MSLPGIVGAVRARTRLQTVSLMSVPAAALTVTTIVTPQAKSFSLNGYLDEISVIETNVVRTAHETVALMASGVTTDHKNRGMKMVDSFVNGIAAIGEFVLLL